MHVRVRGVYACARMRVCVTMVGIAQVALGKHKGGVLLLKPACFCFDRLHLCLGDISLHIPIKVIGNCYMTRRPLPALEGG